MVGLLGELNLEVLSTEDGNMREIQCEPVSHSHFQPHNVTFPVEVLAALHFIGRPDMDVSDGQLRYTLTKLFDLLPLVCQILPHLVIVVFKPLH